MIKLIATDLDGTLLKDDCTIPHDFGNVLKELVKKNVKFIAASGRPYYTLKKDFGSLANHIIFVADNGATIVENEHIIYCDIIEKPLVKRIISQYRKAKDAHIILCCKECAYIESDDPEFIQEVDKYYYNKEIVSNIEDVEDDVIKVTLCHFKNVKKLSEDFFENCFSDELQIVVSGKIWLDIMDNGINKGKGLQKIQDKYAITNGETMVFGDYYNDIPMFERAYYSYAMDNAPEDIKKKAHKIAPSNSEEGVITILKEKFCEKIQG